MILLSAPRSRFSSWIVLVTVLILLTLHHLAFADIGTFSAVRTSSDSSVGLLKIYGSILGGMYLLYQPAVMLVKHLRSSWRALTLAIGIGSTLVGVLGCGSTSSFPSPLNSAFDCTVQARGDLVEALTPTAVTAIHKIADPEGKITVSALKTLFSGASLLSEAGVFVACVEARAVAAVVAEAPLTPTPGIAVSALSGGGHIDTLALRKALSAQFPGVVFKTSR